jgi:hypothetical protein
MLCGEEVLSAWQLRYRKKIKSASKNIEASEQGLKTAR